MWFALLAMISLAQETPESLRPGHVVAYLKSVQELHIDQQLPVPLHDPITVSDGPMTMQLEGGWVTPIWSGYHPYEWPDRDDAGDIPEALRGRRNLAGFMWVEGSGTAELSFPEKSDGLGLANYLAMRGDLEPQAVAALAAGESWTVNIDRGLFLAGPEVTADIFAKNTITELLVPPDDPETLDEIIVIGDRGEARDALRKSRTLFRDRMRLYDWMDETFERRLAIDRARRELYGASHRHALLIADVHTDTTVPLRVTEQTTYDFADTAQVLDTDRVYKTDWFTLVRDDTGENDSRLQTSVRAIHGDQEDVFVSLHLAGAPFAPEDPDDPTSAPWPATYLRHDRAVSTIDVTPWPKDALILQARIQTRLTMAAVGGGSIFRLTVPRGIREKRFGVDVDVQLANGDSLVVYTPHWENEAVTIALPRHLADGESIQLDVTWKAYWPIGGMVELGGEVRGQAKGTGLQWFIPAPVPSQPGNPWAFDATLTWPASLKLSGALSGGTIESGTSSGISRIRAGYEGQASWAAVSLGEWKTRTEPKYKDQLPAMRINLTASSASSLDEFGPELRRIGLFYDRFLPLMPLSELEVIEMPGRPYGLAWVAPHGMVAMQQAFVADPMGQSPGASTTGHAGLRDDRPHFEHGILAHEVAHQVWGHIARPANMRDFWISETMAEGYACWYLAQQFDRKDCRVRMKRYQRTWEKELAARRVRASLSGAYGSPWQPAIVYEYGPYVMFEMLRKRIGDKAFFGALDELSQQRFQQTVTTEQLLAAFESKTNRELDDFFDYWVHTGIVPKLTLDWRVDAEATPPVLTGTLTSDVPFGTIDVPIRVREKGDKITTVWIDVIDGQGAVEIPLSSKKKPKVEIDPEGAVLARTRRENFHKE